jgi:hypothetical protein
MRGERPFDDCDQPADARAYLVARTIAAHLTLESDRILREGHRRMLSAQQVKSLLTTAVSNHLHKLNRVAALELADGITAADGRRSDLIMGWALRLDVNLSDCDWWTVHPSVYRKPHPRTFAAEIPCSCSEIPCSSEEFP